MAIRELSAKEVQNVSGGTFCLLGGLLSFKLNLLSSLFKSCSTPAPTPCQPAPTPCQPAPTTCYTAPKYGC
ncbi:hypothetical protein [Zoogloea sp. 1C4]|uniref:hypothetical protein n=1 Tax=Zoogloea sp. 1C4 TaxID=2570190 RepID=UPI0012908B84|nr:hypothetical protein [Zoogloea sp. 1C4]